jgi:hypothetical protein
MPAQAGIHDFLKASKTLLFCEQKRSKKNFDFAPARLSEVN